MNNFKEREKAFENKFARDEETKFKIENLRNKKIGKAVAEVIGMSDESEIQNYITSVILADLEEPGIEDLVRKIESDFKKHQKEFDINWLEQLIDDCWTEAEKEFKNNS